MREFLSHTLVYFIFQPVSFIYKLELGRSCYFSILEVWNTIVASLSKFIAFPDMLFLIGFLSDGIKSFIWMGGDFSRGENMQEVVS